MEPSTSNLPAPDTVSRMAIRQRPEIRAAPHEPPSQPDLFQFRHPANDLTFLRLPALDYCVSTFKFGIHLGTAITACQILACNENGYLSHSRDPDHGGINVDLESILMPGKYYFHLIKPDPLYPICCDFSSWRFPHGELPAAWVNELPTDNENASAWPRTWTAISAKVKNRDIQCPISLCRDCLTTSHVVPRNHETWVPKLLIFNLG